MNDETHGLKYKTLKENESEDEVEVIKIKNPNPAQNYDLLFRICMVGDAYVGKTSLLIRYFDNTFQESYTSTIGVDFRVISLLCKGLKIKLNVSDTAGQERFKSISSKYYRSAHGFFFVYDITDRQSFNNIKDWIHTTKTFNNNKVVSFLIGNKLDLNNREVSKEEGIKLAKDNDMFFMETSAKDNSNVDDSFAQICKELVAYFTKNKKEYNEIKNPELGIDYGGFKKVEAENKKKGCCK